MISRVDLATAHDIMKASRPANRNIDDGPSVRTSPIIRNPLASPALLAALQWVRPGPEPRMIDRLIRAGRVADAAALAEILIIEADRP
jgi:hypothetical protein